MKIYYDYANKSIIDIVQERHFAQGGINADFIEVYMKECDIELYTMTLAFTKANGRVIAPVLVSDVSDEGDYKKFVYSLDSLILDTAGQLQISCYLTEMKVETKKENEVDKVVYKPVKRDVLFTTTNIVDKSSNIDDTSYIVNENGESTYDDLVAYLNSIYKANVLVIDGEIHKLNEATEKLELAKIDIESALASIKTSIESISNTTNKSLENISKLKESSVGEIVNYKNQSINALDKKFYELFNGKVLIGLDTESYNDSIGLIFQKEDGSTHTDYYSFKMFTDIINGNISVSQAQKDRLGNFIDEHYVNKNRTIVGVPLNQDIDKDTLIRVLGLTKVQNTYDNDKYVKHAETSGSSSADDTGRGFVSGYANTLELVADSANHKYKWVLLSPNRTLLSEVEIDLPLESVVVNAEYISSTKKIKLTLNNGSTTDFSVADLVSGLQNEITPTNKLPFSLIDGGPDLSGYQPLITDSDKLSYNLLKDTPEIPEPVTSDTFDEGLRIYHHYGTPNSDSQYPDEVHNIYLQRLQADGTYKTISKIRFYDDLSVTLKACRYDNDTKQLIFTGYGGMEKKVSLAPLIEGLQPLLGATNKLNPQYVSEDDNYQFISKALKQVIVDLNDAGVIEKLDNIEQENIEFSTWAHNAKSSMATFKSYLGLE